MTQKSTNGFPTFRDLSVASVIDRAAPRSALYYVCTRSRRALILLTRPLVRPFRRAAISSPRPAAANHLGSLIILLQLTAVFLDGLFINAALCSRERVYELRGELRAKLRTRENAGRIFGVPAKLCTVEARLTSGVTRAQGANGVHANAKKK